MRLLRLDLARYGHLSDVSLRFDDSAALHVVYGANEAGKSTALAAVADALFGFGHRSEYDFLHGGPNLRIGFALTARDRTTAAFVRRKGRRDTLRDAGDQPLDEETLQGFLGGASREMFERGFGLDGKRLREGGMDLLRSGGEAGESLLAGSGLLNLRAALSRLEDEAKALFGDGRGKRRVPEAVEAWRAAQRESEDRAVAPAAWKETVAAHDAAAAELESVQASARALSAEGSRLQRVRRVAPILATLDAARETLAPLADAPHLPADADARMRDAIAALRDATRDAERDTGEAARLTAERAGLAQDDAALAAQDAIDALARRGSVVEQALLDLPDVRAAVVTHRRKVADAIEDLGVSLTPEAARDGVPSSADRRAVQTLVNKRSALAATIASADRAFADARLRRAKAEAALQETPEPPSPALLRRTIDGVRGEGPLDTEVSRTERTLANAARDAAAKLAALPLWTGDMAALIACELPLASETDAAAARLDAAAQMIATHRAGIATIAAEIVAKERELAAITRGATVPTADVVAHARFMRDHAWRLIRAWHEGGPEPDIATRGGIPEGNLLNVFENLRDEADRLADRRADEAQRVELFEATTRALAELQERHRATSLAHEAAERELTDAEVTWETLWSRSGLRAAPPTAMAEWRQGRAEVLRLATAEEEARRLHDDAAARRDRARAELAALLPAVAETETLMGLSRRAETLCAAAEEAAAAYRERQAAFAREEARLREFQAAVADASAALGEWQARWADAVIVIGLAADATPETAEIALGAWTRIAEAAPAWRADEARVSDMNATVAAFSRDVGAARAALGEAALDEPDTVTAARLARRLDTARKMAAAAAALSERIAKHEAAAASARRKLGEAEQDLAALRELAGAADEPALAEAISRARGREAAVAAVANAMKTLLAQGDGFPETALREELAATGADAAVARLLEIDAEAHSLDERRDHLVATRVSAAAALNAMREGRDAASKAQEAEDALADARAHAERYARLHIARTLLRAGIERFRREEQGPLLRAAGTHFAQLTGGRYVRLEADQTDTGKTILRAIRDTGHECPVEALSEGTRDQLYLALRVASVEAQARRAEPLPFIADDLLVHFDDVRAQAAISLLTELGRTTQVILFTHHDHIAALAGSHADVAVQRLASQSAPRLHLVGAND